MKIITFTKNNQFQALLQYNDAASAQQAKVVGVGSVNGKTGSLCSDLYNPVQSN